MGHERGRTAAEALERARERPEFGPNVRVELDDSPSTRRLENAADLLTSVMQWLEDLDITAVRSEAARDGLLHQVADIWDAVGTANWLLGAVEK